MSSPIPAKSNKSNNFVLHLIMLKLVKIKEEGKIIKGAATNCALRLCWQRNISKETEYEQEERIAGRPPDKALGASGLHYCESSAKSMI
ncbi:MAG: hypothetical protein WA634_15305 [Silvibacterium sp.]